MKKITAFLLAVAMVFSLAATAFAASVTPVFSATSVAAGETVTVELKLDEAMTGITNFEYRLFFNPDLFALQSSTKGPANSLTTITSKAKTNTDGTYYGISMVDPTSQGMDVNPGVIYTLVFTAKADLTAEQAAAFKLVRRHVTGYGAVAVDDGDVTSGEVTITVTPANVAVTGISLDKSALTLTVGGTGTLTATVDPENATDKTVTWTSSNESVATVADGVVTAVASGSTTITAKAGEVEATCTVTVTEKQEEIPADGYTYATSADVTADNGGTAVVHVKVTGHPDPNVTTYNAYDLTLTFDTDKLEYVSYDGAVKSDNGQVKVEGSNIRIVGCGEPKEFGTEIVALTFRTKAEGAALVTINKVQVSDKEESVTEDIPEATAKHDENDTTTEGDTTPDQSVIQVPYTVTKPAFVSGNDKILHGENYTFSYTDTTNYTYSGLKVTVDGTEVTPTEADGDYTIANVTGAVVIEATQTANSYDVTKPENVTGPDRATYGTDYIFTVTPGEDMAIDTVTVSTADGTEIPYTISENGEYVIAGNNISGPFTITVTQRAKMTTITFTGIEAKEVEGGLTQSAEIGKDFSFKLIKEAAYAYTVTVGETELSESTETPGQYTIPANLVVQGGVTVNITKDDTSKVVVDVYEYISLDGKVMFLVTAKWRDKVLSYGEGNTMFWSSKYTVTGYEDPGAYCWLVVSTDELYTKDAVKTAAEAAIVEAAAGITATAISYDFDINETTKVDVNDAQLAYDMYNASYMEFTDNLPMLKFLEADVAISMDLDVNDVAAVINYIVNGAAN